MVRILIVATVCLALLNAGCGSDRPAVLDQPIVVLGFDGADWTWIDPLIEGGKMPHLKKLVDSGVRSDLTSLRPLQKSPTIWTSIATGKRPSKHGVGGFQGKGGGLTTGSSRTAATYWEVLGTLGLRQAVLGWWMTYPVTPVQGALISDFVQYAGQVPVEPERAVYPPELWSWVAGLVVKPEDLTLEDLSRFIDVDIARAHGPEIQRLRLLEDLRKHYAADESYRRIAKELYGRESFDVFTLYYRGLDAMCHAYWRYFKRNSTRMPLEDWAVDMLKDLIPAYHEYVDELIGEALGWIRPDSRILICSDHGIVGHRQTARGLTMGVDMHRLEGVLVASGDGFRAGTVLDRAEVKDIAPTLLAIAGIPPARDFDGHILGEALDPDLQKWCDRLLPDAVPSYDGLMPPRETGDNPDPEVEAEILDRLRSLGYIE